MFGWASDATARASRSKRARSASGPSSLSATSRPSSRSSAHQTSDIPPRPRTSCSRYRPAMTVSGFGTPIRYARIVSDVLDLGRAQALVLKHAAPLPSERVALGDALGRVTALPATATVDLPPFASSAMDGFAVRSADVPGLLRIVGEAAAGRPASAPLGEGEAVAISTGGVVPAGADAVIPIEYVVQHDNSVE